MLPLSRTVMSILVLFLAASPVVAEPPEPRLHWIDGGDLSGRPIGMEADRLRWRTPLFAEPLSIHRNVLNAMRFDRPRPSTVKPPLDGAPDRLIHEGLTSTGTLGIEEGRLGWRPLGGATDHPLLPGNPVRFAVGPVDAAPGFDLALFPSLLFLHGGDVLPCHIESLDQEFVHATTPFGGPIEMSHQRVKALEFNGVGKMVRAGFDETGWVLDAPDETAAERDRNEITFRGDASFSCSSLFGNRLLQEISLDLKTSTMSSTQLTVCLYSGDHQTPTDVTPYRLHLLAGGVSGRVNRGEYGIFRDHNNFGRESSSYKIRVWPSDGKLHLSVNGHEGPTIPLSTPRCTGFALETTVDRPPWGDDAWIAVSNFKAYSKGYTTGHLGIDSEKVRQTLTLSRLYRNEPPSHVLVGCNGDLLRGQFMGLGEKLVRFRSRGKEIELDRDNIDAIVWLHPDGVPAEPAGAEAGLVQVTLNTLGRVVLVPEQLTDEALIGRSPILGPCTIPKGMVSELRIGRHDELKDIGSYTDWQPTFTIDPRWSPSEGPLTAAQSKIGEKVEPIELSLLDGKPFNPGDPAGRVVVLNFWSSWCRPCLRLMPVLQEVTEEFEPDAVWFVTVNASESADPTKRFLEAHGLEKLTVALDQDDALAKQLGVTTIPYSVVIGPDGVVEWASGSHAASVAEELRHAIREALEPADAEPPKE